MPRILPIRNVVVVEGKDRLLTYGWRLRYLAGRAQRAQARYERAADKAWGGQ